MAWKPVLLVSAFGLALLAGPTPAVAQESVGLANEGVDRFLDEIENVVGTERFGGVWLEGDGSDDVRIHVGLVGAGESDRARVRAMEPDAATVVLHEFRSAYSDLQRYQRRAYRALRSVESDPAQALFVATSENVLVIEVAAGMEPDVEALLSHKLPDGSFDVRYTGFQSVGDAAELIRGPNRWWTLFVVLLLVSVTAVARRRRSRERVMTKGAPDG